VTKDQFVKDLAGKLGETSHGAHKILDSVLDTLSETLASGQEINFVGFGKFSVADRASRQGINPRTQEPLTIPASRVVKFQPGSKLKAAVQ
jgi:DNA-binding protein HU-beta